MSSSSSSSIISCSSSDSVPSFWLRKAGCGCGDFEDAEGGGVSEGEVFSWLFVELSAKLESNVTFYRLNEVCLKNIVVI